MPGSILSIPGGGRAAQIPHRSNALVCQTFTNLAKAGKQTRRQPAKGSVPAIVMYTM
jgi:hypothetical protein